MINNDEFVISSLIQKLRDEEHTKVILENFPMKKEFLNLFVKNAKKFSKIIYLDCDDFNCMKRMKLMDKESPNYVGAPKLSSLIHEHEKKKDVIKLIKEKTNFMDINSNRPLDLVKDEILSKLRPTIYIVNSPEKYLKIRNEIINIFVGGLKYELIDVYKKLI